MSDSRFENLERRVERLETRIGEQSIQLEVMHGDVSTLKRDLSVIRSDLHRATDAITSQSMMMGKVLSTLQDLVVFIKKAPTP